MLIYRSFHFPTLCIEERQTFLVDFPGSRLKSFDKQCICNVFAKIQDDVSSQNEIFLFAEKSKSNDY